MDRTTLKIDPFDRAYKLTIVIFAWLSVALMIGCTIYVNVRYGPQFLLSAGFVANIIIIASGAWVLCKVMFPKPPKRSVAT